MPEIYERCPKCNFVLYEEPNVTHEKGVYVTIFCINCDYERLESF